MKDKKGLIVVATNNGMDYIEKCISKYMQFKNNEDILIVDTGSSDIDYINYTKELCSRYKIQWDQTKEPRYDYGAYIHAFENYKYNYYIFHHDSIMVKRDDTILNLKNILYNENYDCVSFLSFHNTVCMFGTLAEKEFCQNNFNSSFYEYGIYGPNFIIKYDSLKLLYEKYKLNSVVVDNKSKQMAMERGWAIMLTNEKLKYKSIEEFTAGETQLDGYWKLFNDGFNYFTKIKHKNGYRN